ncbi:hypothetical protein M433DRAFT_2079 [Acidomyces richmondensis BFW]|nr:MAG: hypothetical protein FE78DRAFT_137972 [Acidomyces sp. 'richmondensis']KYG48300.1 hypothetical protein M433DRAFT_2079 [Acidomyces richmondensis BFW]
MLFSLTVGKVDAGVAVLLTEDKRLIEFPSILLPPDIHSGSIVDINVSRNQHAELIAEQKFAALQDDILQTFGARSPSPPVLRCRNATQTSVVLEWDPIELATAELRSLSLYRNGSKAGNIPVGKLSTKISGLALDTEYTFHLVLRTSAGQYSSEKITVKTHKMTDLHGITITPGVMPEQLKESLKETVNKIGARIIDQVRIDTTHFVCTEPRGQSWEKAVEMNIPVVVPDWVKGCEREGRMVPARAYYLDADPSKRQIGPSATQRTSVSSSAQQARDSPRIEHTPPTPDRPTHDRAAAENGAAPTNAPSSTSAEESTPTDALSDQTIEQSGNNAETNDRNGASATVAARSKSAESNDEMSEGSSEEENDASSETEKIKGLAENRGTEGETKAEAATDAAEEEGKFDEVDL